MGKKYQVPRGTHDILGQEMARFETISHKAAKIFHNYGFSKWETPIFEDISVFLRSLGETSDVVSKEMYLFKDRGGEELTLRPEGTASICRALVTNSLTQKLPQRVYYEGPMFRYERPQKGRYREFHQIGAEYFGADTPLRDAETISMANDFLTELGLIQNIRLELNTLGDIESRLKWREALVDYFSQYKAELSADSQTRLVKNPLRILDSKDEKDKKFLLDAPKFIDYMNELTKKFWDELRNYLTILNIDFVENPNIVRGMDYYSHTAFEFTTDLLGAQATVLAGGRYEKLVEEMGGPAVPAIGWAAGMERLAALIEDPVIVQDMITIIPLGDDALKESIILAHKLRQENFHVLIETRGGSMKKRMEKVIKTGASIALFLGEDDLKNKSISFRNLITREQRNILQTDIISELKKSFSLK